jgi:hypothetical protein
MSSSAKSNYQKTLCLMQAYSRYEVGWANQNECATQTEINIPACQGIGGKYKFRTCDLSRVRRSLYP